MPVSTRRFRGTHSLLQGRDMGSEPEGESGAPLMQQGRLGPSVVTEDVPPRLAPKVCSSVQDALSGVSP